MTRETLIKTLNLTEFGYLNEQNINKLVELDRLYPVLVRCDGCRFSAPAQDIVHIITLIEKGGDYVRDVSLM